MFEVEEWKVNPFNPRYSVSNMGRIRRDVSVKGSGAGRIIRGSSDQHGYLQQELPRRGGKRRLVMVHRVVAVAFLGEPPPGRIFVNHKDGNKQNNRADNLEWCTRKENAAHAWATGLISAKCGASHGMAKLTTEDVVGMREKRANGAPLVELAAEYRVTEAHVNRIALRKFWQHVP